MYFIIKWRAWNGSEMLYSGRDISFSPNGLCNGTHQDPALAKVTFYDKNDTFCSLDLGRVFVMNDNGKTISDWNLSAMNEPKSERQSA
jgi:hypothetical protein